MSDIHRGQMTRDKRVDPRLVGIRGWLLLPAIGLVVSTLVSILLACVGIVCALLGVLNVRRLLSSLRETVQSDYGVCLVPAIAIGAVILSYCCVACWRFFKKRKSAPRTYIRLLAFVFVASLYLFALRLVVFGADGVLALVFSLGAYRPLAAGIAAAIWIPYFKMSARVRATFVQEDSPCLPYKIVLPMRYLIRRRISWLAFTVVALCVFIVVVVMTVMTGLVQEFKEKNHAFVGDCVVGTKSLVGFPYYEEFMAILDESELVAGVSPVVKNYAFLHLADYDAKRGVEIMGLDPVRHGRTTNFDQTLHFRADEPNKAFVPIYDPNALGCVWGIDLFLLRNAQGQYSYGARPPHLSVTLTCFPLNARGAPARAGAGLVNSQKFLYSDNSRSGIARVDGSLVYIPLEEAQRLCMGGTEKRVNVIHVAFRPGVSVAKGTARVAELWRHFKEAKADAPNSFLLDTVTVQDWKGYRRAFIAPMEKEQVLLSLMFVLVGITTVFIVFVVFYMIISHKKRDIGVLKSVGASQVGILSLFSGFALAIGFLGSCIGAHLGWLFLAKINAIEQWLFEHFGFQLWDRSIYVIGEIPHHVEFHVLAVIMLSAIVSCLVGALIPGYLAARLRPVETLHALRT